MTVFSGSMLNNSNRFSVQEMGPTALYRMNNPAIAKIVATAIHHNAQTLGHYQLHSFAVMPNHVHMLITPKVPLPVITKSLKNITAKRANELLNRKGKFWQDESFDREVRNSNEFEKIHQYIENNPVRAGLVQEPASYRWSSAFYADPQQ